MTTDQMILFAIFAAVMLMMVWGKWRYDLVAFAGLLVGVLTGVVPQAEAFTGFSNPATLVVALILVVTAGLRKAGVVEMLTRKLASTDRSIPLHIGVLGTVGGFLSGFMNNVAALAILMPIDLRVARKAGRSAGLTLMPLAFATILGGMCTLIGTPPNLLVSNFRRDTLGEGFGMFAFLPVGGAVALAGLAFVALIGWRLIPRRDKAGTQGPRERLRDYVTALVVGGTAAGKPMTDLAEAAAKADVAIIALERGGRRFYRTAGPLILAPGDLLIIEAAPEAIEAFRAAANLAFPDGEDAPAALPDGAGHTLVEAVVPQTARILGQRARRLTQFAQGGDVILLGIQRPGATLREKLGGQRIRHGDVLLLLLPEGQADEIADALGLVLIEDSTHAVTKPSRLWGALACFVAAIAATTLGWTSMPVALGLVIVAYVLGGIMTIEELYDHIDWPIIVLLGAMIPLGMALDTTGGSVLIAGGIARLTGGAPAWVALTLLMAATMFLSDILNNNATTILAAPIGISLAQTLGVNPDAFLMGVAVAASCAFLTPIGHQNNMLILGPGDYRFGDYWRMGLPLEMIVMAVSVPMLLIVFPL